MKIRGTKVDVLPLSCYCIHGGDSGRDDFSDDPRWSSDIARIFAVSLPTRSDFSASGRSAMNHQEVSHHGHSSLRVALRLCVA